ncbi:unnamed protein product [Peniophora sp. CBMAI 1063]|nr:unnamed protein product [Peniophora sp. CBMAI 1063]
MEPTHFPYDVVSAFKRGEVQSDCATVIWGHVYPFVVETMLFTFELVLAGNIVWKHRTNLKTASRHDICLVSVTVAMLGLLSAYWAVDMYKLLGLATPTLNDHGVALAHLVIAYSIFLLGDCIVLWRAYVLYGRPRWLRITTIVLAVVFTGQYSAFAALQLPLLGRIANIGPNLIATLLIAYKTWAHWRDVRRFSGDSDALAILLVIIESGFFYSVMPILEAVLALVISAATAHWFACILTPLFAMYPTLVVVLVRTRRTMLERSAIASCAAETMQWEVHVPDSERGREDSRPHSSS